MTPEQVIAAVEKYKSGYWYLKGEPGGVLPSLIPKRCPGETKGPAHLDAAAHLLWMCDQTKLMAHSNTEKAMRWLGFIQGVLWAKFGVSIDEMKDDNR